MSWIDDAVEKISIVLADWEGTKQMHNITDEIIEQGKEILANGKDTEH